MAKTQKPHLIRIIVAIMLAVLLIRYSFNLISMYLEYGIAMTHGELKQPISPIFGAVVGIFTIITLLLPYKKGYHPIISNPWPISILSTALILSPVIMYVIYEFHFISINIAIFGFVLAINLRYSRCKNNLAYRTPLTTALIVAILPGLAYIYSLILILTDHAKVG